MDRHGCSGYCALSQVKLLQDFHIFTLLLYMLCYGDYVPHLFIMYIIFLCVFPFLEFLYHAFVAIKEHSVLLKKKEKVRDVLVG